MIHFKRTPRFDRAIRRLQKRYPKLKIDLATVFETIEKAPDMGDVIPDDFSIRKLRVASSDMQRGKSGGFRLLYKLITDEKTVYAVLLFIYAKTDQDDVPGTFLQTLSDELDEP